MQDKKLLELAAKAAGTEVDVSILFAGGSKSWNPLLDDGDALRLAVQLGICIGPNFDNDRAVADAGEFSQHHAVEMFGSDKSAATRRAIVRAAAEIGRSV